MADAEKHFHQAMLHRNPFRVLDPTNANMFYVPVYPSPILQKPPHRLGAG